MAEREFHIRRDVREEYGLQKTLFSLRGNVILADFRAVRELARKFNAKAPPGGYIQAGQLNAMALIDEILHYITALYREAVQNDLFGAALTRIEDRQGPGKTGLLLENFCTSFPPREVYGGKLSAGDYLASSEDGESNRSLSLEEILHLALANLNPAFGPFLFMFDDDDLQRRTIYHNAVEEMKTYFAELPPFGPDGQNLWDLLRAPALASPDSLTGQLDFIRRKWGALLGKYMGRLLTAMDVIREEEKPVFFGPGPQEALTYGGLDEYERFSPDQEWMPKTVLLAKSTLVWLYQLSRKYGREITRLDRIPDEELDEIARRGFTGLWLIGIWERSAASRTIKQWSGNPEAAASAYSLSDYDIAGELGGWDALTNLRDRCFRRGIRLGSDMVPNHTGIDSRWIIEHPDRFLQLPYPPFPLYRFTSGNLASRDDVTVQIEDHYYTKTDAAVVFKRTDNRTGEARYIYHGNDGTSMPWNDTAQIDFLNPEAREAVIRTIIGVCKQFSIVRFDAAMTLAKRHIQRLWYPEPGHGGDIASRAEHALSNDEFNRRIPNEFWREVVDRCAAEAPHTLLLAEAFWMMEGYFVRTLGMHRVYNSAFMNMLKNEDNAKYRATIKNTLEYDPEILKRFVNFMNNPDEETAVAQFGKGDKYFGICTLLVTMPGLPMFGHGQIEGFEEKYGMEYRRAYRDEEIDRGLLDRHEREIFPLMKKRYLFSGSADFCLFDLYGDNGVNENVFAYSNRSGGDTSLVIYNNVFARASGWIREGAAHIPQKGGGTRRDTLGAALRLSGDDLHFTLLREQRQNRWFIRSSKDLAERGIFVSLNGYEAQVFLDIHEVADRVPGSAELVWAARWSKLNAALDGAGAPDLDSALQDIFLADLYAPFLQALGRADELALLTGKSGADTADAAAFAASLTGAAERFAREAFRFLDGAEGRYERWPAAGAKKRAVKGSAIKDASADFAVHIRCILTLGKGIEKDRSLDAATVRLFRDLAGEISARPGYALYALAAGLLGTLRRTLDMDGPEFRSLIEFWNLDRKMREAFAEAGSSGDEAWRAAEFIKAVLARSGGADITAEYLALENYGAADIRALLRVNVFEDVTWYNKEAFEEALTLFPLFALAEAGMAIAARAAGITAAFRRAGVLSGYRLDQLMASLAPAKPPAKTGGAKANPRADTPRKTAQASPPKNAPDGAVSEPDTVKTAAKTRTARGVVTKNAVPVKADVSKKTVKTALPKTPAAAVKKSVRGAAAKTGPGVMAGKPKPEPKTSRKRADGGKTVPVPAKTKTAKNAVKDAPLKKASATAAIKKNTRGAEAKPPARVKKAGPVKNIRTGAAIAASAAKTGKAKPGAKAEKPKTTAAKPKTEPKGAGVKKAAQKKRGAKK
jgi:glycosidase